MESTYKELANRQKKVHEKAFENRLKDGSVEMWLNDDNADYWGNTFPLHELKEAFLYLNDKKILTVGDGKGGKEASFLKQLGCKVTASDIVATVLEEAYNRKIIDDYLELDAENLDLEDSTFDIVVTKETLHHLPRPYLALYEMLRVAKDGIVVIEPRQYNLYEVDKLPSKGYEVSGNYLFNFSINEIVKIARSFGAKNVAYKFSRIFHMQDAGLIKDEELEALKAKETQKYAEEDMKKRNLITFLIWKTEMSEPLQDKLYSQGFKIIDTRVPEDMKSKITEYLQSFEIE